MPLGKVGIELQDPGPEDLCLGPKNSLTCFLSLVSQENPNILLPLAICLDIKLLLESTLSKKVEKQS